MKFTLKIEAGNAQMQTPADVATALTRVAERLLAQPEDEDYANRIQDQNGNTVGEYEFYREPEAEGLLPGDSVLTR